MSARWVGGCVRARAATNRRLGSAGARSLALSGSLEQALVRLAAGPYGHDVRPGQSLRQAQHAVAATFLWHLRVLAGWLPHEGVEAVRLLAGWAEIANLEDLLRSYRATTRGGSGTPGRSPAPAYRLGSLGTAWPRARDAAGPDELTAVLAESAWGDPGDTDERTVTAFLRLTWAARVAASVPTAAGWAAGAAALVAAHDLAEREAFGHRTPPATVTAAVGRALGPRAAATTTLSGLREAVPLRARWALEPSHDLDDLWRAEAAWWRRVGSDAAALTRSSSFELAPVVGVVGLLACDAWRVRAALEVASRSGAGLEAFDAVV